MVRNQDRADYRGVELTYTKRLSRRWQLLASYTYSVARGSGVWTATSESDDSRRIPDQYGYLDYDQRHVLKLDGSVLLPGGVLLGGSARYFSGLPYSINEHDYDDRNANGIFDLGESVGFGSHFVGPRNAYRSESYATLDLLAEKEFSFKGWTLGLFANVLNAFNDQSATRTSANVVAYDEGCNPARRQCFPPGGVSYYEETLFGRQFQLGFRFAFGGTGPSVGAVPPPRRLRAPAPPAPSPPEETSPPPETPTPTPSSAPASGPIRGRTVVGDVAAFDPASGLLRVDLGLGRLRTVVVTEETRIRGGDLQPGQRVRVRLDIETRSRHVATSIKILSP